MHDRSSEMHASTTSHDRRMAKSPATTPKASSELPPRRVATPDIPLLKLPAPISRPPSVSPPEISAESSTLRRSARIRSSRHGNRLAGIPFSRSAGSMSTSTADEGLEALRRAQSMDQAAAQCQSTDDNKTEDDAEDVGDADDVDEKDSSSDNGSAYIVNDDAVRPTTDEVGRTVLPARHDASGRLENAPFAFVRHGQRRHQPRLKQPDGAFFEGLHEAWRQLEISRSDDATSPTDIRHMVHPEISSPKTFRARDWLKESRAKLRDDIQSRGGSPPPGPAVDDEPAPFWHRVSRRSSVASAPGDLSSAIADLQNRRQALARTRSEGAISMMRSTTERDPRAELDEREPVMLRLGRVKPRTSAGQAPAEAGASASTPNRQGMQTLTRPLFGDTGDTTSAAERDLQEQEDADLARAIALSLEDQDDVGDLEAGIMELENDVILPSIEGIDPSLLNTRADHQREDMQDKGKGRATDNVEAALRQERHQKELSRLRLQQEIADSFDAMNQRRSFQNMAFKGMSDPKTYQDNIAKSNQAFENTILSSSASRERDDREARLSGRVDPRDLPMLDDSDDEDEAISFAGNRARAGTTTEQHHGSKLHPVATDESPVASTPMSPGSSDGTQRRSPPSPPSPPERLRRGAVAPVGCITGDSEDSPAPLTPPPAPRPRAAQLPSEPAFEESVPMHRSGRALNNEPEWLREDTPSPPLHFRQKQRFSPTGSPRPRQPRQKNTWALRLRAEGEKFSKPLFSMAAA
ncbi:hypothetical protein BDZ85DRAFT_13425 [Elsinoe ampelina]|uniref:Uncharacterized protein n=1 Tax=Elsinoe ampelina TaxID=302913 RepID=A0A6A6GRA6_9PEZI|nr:hypothetical protein BDZ85DRAFT_13425 [Elsinoe ampelina]